MLGLLKIGDKVRTRGFHCSLCKAPIEGIIVCIDPCEFDEAWKSSYGEHYGIERNDQCCLHFSPAYCWENELEKC